MNARKLSLWYKAIADAEDALAAMPKDKSEIDPGTPVDVDQAYRDAVVTARNTVLAGSGEKAELLGTLSTPPTADAKALTDAGLEGKENDELLAKAAELRATALAIVVPAVVKG
jgi:hypothetical protein